MAEAPRPWIVTPHGPLERLEENLLVVTATLPKMRGMNRRMAVVRLGDGRLVFHNGIPLGEPELAELARFGEAAFLVVPNGFHRLDVHAFRERFPGLRVIAPALAARRVGEVVRVDGGFELLPPDPALVVEPLGGLRSGEVALVVGSGAGHARRSLLFGDAVFNLPHAKGLDGLVLRLLGSSGGPRTSRLFRLVAVGDRGRFRESLVRLAATPGLVRLVPSHGADVIDDPAGTLLRIAETL
jgi:hypothetical protein